MTFMPPAVEPAHPPTNISKTITTFAAVSHRSKSAVTNPVVVMMLETVNAESLQCLAHDVPVVPFEDQQRPTRRALPPR